MTEPKLYIIMREDLWDNNPGKMMAQSAHAQAEFDAYQNSLVNHNSDEFWQAIADWREDREFGVTLVLHEPLGVMEEICTLIKHSGITVDPTYPYRNWYGKAFTRSEPTCMWAFVYTEEDLKYMHQFDLHS